MKPLPNLRFISLKVVLVLLCCFSISTIYAQSRYGTIKGTVRTSDHKAGEFVNVYIKALKRSTTTDENGRYELSRIEAGTQTVTVSYVGLSTTSQTVEVLANKTITSDFMLEQSKGELQEIMINASKTNKYKRTRSEYVSKMPLSNLENPQVYTTITSQLMQDQLVYSVDDAMRNATGIARVWEATGRGGDGGSYYSSRGFVTQAKLRNGIAGNVTSSIDGSNLDHIEIIKGPSATLFGNALTTYGGLINRVTKKAYDSVGAEVALSAGSYDYFRSSIDFNSPLDKEKKVLFRLNSAYNYKGSFQDAGFNRNYNIAPTITYNPNDRLSITLEAEIMAGRSQISPYYFLLGTTGLGTNRADELGFDYKKSYLGNDLSQYSRNANFFGQATYKISDSWTSTTNASLTNSYSDGFGPYFYLLPGDSISRNDQSTAKSKDQTLEIQQNFNGDFNIAGLRNRVVIGLDYLHRNSNQHYLGASYDAVPLNSATFNYAGLNAASLSALYASTTPSEYPYIYKSDTYSAYVSDVLNITDRLLAIAAIRVDRFKNGGSYYPPSTEPVGAYNQTAFAPKFGLVYQPIKDVVSVFANYQNGFTNVNGVDYQSKVFKPEQANQIEGGVKLNAFDGRLSSTISYYDIKVKDIVRTDNTLPAPNNQIQNGTQVSKGIEAEITANPFAGFNVTTGFAYNDSKYENTSADLDGLRPNTAGSPYLFNFWASYRLPAHIIKGLGVGFGGNYASDNKIINSRAVGQGVFILPAYTLLNASAFWDYDKHIRFAVKADNFTNKQYYIGYGTVNPQQLRSFIGTISYKF
ncbi:iron complex outermembrane recepter protein [Pedobacter westerhofensis]|uniref:Iron complex outermembrane recepter protein n=1 Tax=Pedobacter westerhofensis TaxID=425512 RepID=A0A521F6C3_9SPHI|nr:TonB-dependent receptor [Pedobacter westerhofensis]SMO91732.1 iron complex outermembrane recepter protein [Pedobacter westerhofensis]